MQKYLSLFILLVVVSLVISQNVRIDLSRSVADTIPRADNNTPIAPGVNSPITNPPPLCNDLPTGWQPGRMPCDTALATQRDVCQHYLMCWSLSVTGGNRSNLGYTRTNDGRYCKEPYGTAFGADLATYNECLRQGGGAAGTVFYTPPPTSVANNPTYGPVSVSDINFDKTQVAQGSSYLSRINGSFPPGANFGAIYTFNNGSEITVPNWQLGAEKTHQVPINYPLGDYTITKLYVTYAGESLDTVVWQGSKTIRVVPFNYSVTPTPTATPTPIPTPTPTPTPSPTANPSGLVPRISSFTPLAAQVGDTVTVSGSNFYTGSCPIGMGAPERSATVLIGTRSVSVSSYSATSLKFVVPNLYTGTYNLRVVSGGCVTRSGQTSGFSTRLLTVIDNADSPTVYYLAPLSLRPGNSYTVTAYGTNLGDINIIGAEQSSIVVNLNSITTVPLIANKVRFRFRLEVKAGTQAGIQYLNLEDDSGQSLRFPVIIAN